MYVKMCDIVLSVCSERRGILWIEGCGDHLYQKNREFLCFKLLQRFLCPHLFVENNTEVCILMSYKLCIECKVSPAELMVES